MYLQYFILSYKISKIIYRSRKCLVIWKKFQMAHFPQGISLGFNLTYVSRTPCFTKIYFQTVLFSFKNLLNCINLVPIQNNINFYYICILAWAVQLVLKSHTADHILHTILARTHVRVTLTIHTVYCQLSIESLRRILLPSGKKEDVLHRLKMAQQFVGTAL